MSAAEQIVGLQGRYSALQGRHSLPGIPAVVRLIVDQMRRDRRLGLNTGAFISGYPGSPLAGLDRELNAQDELLREHQVFHQPGLNEELAATAVFGSQAASVTAGFEYDGVLGVWYGKAPGLDRAADAIRHANFAGTGPTSGALVLVGDDPACKSSTLPSASEGLCADLRLPVLHPSDSQDILDLGHHAIALSRFSGLWTALKLVTVVADGTSTAHLAIDRVTPRIPSAGEAHRVQPRLHQPYTGEQEREIEQVRLPRAREYAVANGLNAVTVDAPGAWLGVVAAGHTYLDVIEAFGLLGLGRDDLASVGVRILRLTMTYPLDRGEIRRFAAGLSDLLVVEEKRPFVEPALRSMLYGVPDAPVIEGKEDKDGAGLVPSWGVLDAARLEPVLRSRLQRRVDPSRLRPPAPQRPTRDLVLLSASRPPWFCSGCPHATSTRVPLGSLVGTGIGCHALASRMEPERTGTVLSNTQMGGEGAQWIGAAPFLRTRHMFQNMGDGTLAHSGWLAIRFAVEARSQITFKLLFNDAVAMTGGQHAAGARSVADVVRGLKAEGVGRIIITTEDPRRYRRVKLADGVQVWDRTRILDAQAELAAEAGVTVLLHDQECAAELRRKRSRGLVPAPAQKVVINHRVCEACGDCGAKSACLSLHTVDTPFGPKTDVHQSSCNLDRSCLEGDCPSFMLVEPARRSRWRRRSATTPAAARRQANDEVELADLTRPLVDEHGYAIRMPGIGGTGVVTVAQILSMAATLDGLVAHGLDQTGLSQKAGAVVSDLLIAGGDQPRPGRMSGGAVDLYLIFDQLVALSGDLLDEVDPARTVIVGSRSWTPTGPTIGQPFAQRLDITAAEESLAQRAKRSIWIDAAHMAESLLGKTTAANILLIGVAYQHGALPVTAASIEQAIRQNGVAAEANIAAFRAGRRYVVAPWDAAAHVSRTTPHSSLRDAVSVLGGGELAELAAHRSEDLVGYQSVRYARKYLDLVQRAAATGDVEFAVAVARNLYKLMAYKDEYEVARLHVNAESVEQAQAVAGSGARRSLMLHPPLLRALGMRRKLRLGPGFLPLLRILAWARWLRGTPLDPFGVAHVRRVERRLIAQYVARIDELIGNFENLDRVHATEIASLPDLVRGYEGIKLASVARYEQRLAELTEQMLSTAGGSSEVQPLDR
jgi:indolepyruvate ferredoxin oxidoreductase